MTLCGKGIDTSTGCLGGGGGSFWLDRLVVWLGFFSSIGWELLGLEDDDGKGSTCFPLLRVMTLTLSLGFMMVWDGRVPKFYIFYCSLIDVAIWPICVLRSWISATLLC